MNATVTSLPGVRARRKRRTRLMERLAEACSHINCERIEPPWIKQINGVPIAQVSDEMILKEIERLQDILFRRRHGGGSAGTGHPAGGSGRSSNGTARD